jgi:tetraacyldisaccharide 4'-kinase
MSVELWLQSLWYAPGPAPWWLRALAPLYGAGVRLRQSLYARGWLRTQRVAGPVIVVGNLTVGGTGKTPFVIWLVERLRELGFAVAVVTRGYGRSYSRRVTNDILRVDASCRAEDVGDEALLLSRRADCPVYVCRDRVAAARVALADGARVVIADDGLQHLRLARDAEIVLVDAMRGWGNGALLPAGPLREEPARAALATAVVLTGDGTPAAALSVHVSARMQLEGSVLRPVGGAGDGRALASLAGECVHALAGIGNPARFFATLRSARLKLIEHPFPDHHRYLATELQFDDGLPVIMTEKDAVKCQSIAPQNCWYLPVTARFSAAEGRALLGRILMDARLLDILACPVCKGPLRLVAESGATELVCRADRLAYPVRDGIPVMLEEAARQLQSTDPLLER